MRKATAAAVLVFVSALPAFAGTIRVAALAGTVEVRPEPEGSWSPAVVGFEVPEGGSLRTSGDGRAEIEYPDGTKVWLRESSEITLESERTLLGRLSLLYGGLKARVTHLSSSRRLEFKTSTAVAAVRGTELVISQGQDGKFDLNVLFGRVELRIPGAGSVFVPQGHGYLMERAGQAGESRLMDRGEEIRGLMDWKPGLTAEKRIERLSERDERRSDMRGYARRDKDQRGRLADLIARQKEEDLAAGRTLFDVHGNLVRVHQLLVRPDPKSFQLVNLVKRPNYEYVERQHSWAYNGPTSITNRLDVAELVYRYDKRLPDDLSAWPKFFGDHKPQHTELSFVNMTDKLELHQIAYIGQRDPNDQDKLKLDLYVGRVACTQARDCLEGLHDYKDNLGTGTSICDTQNCHRRFVEPPAASEGTRIRDTPDGPLIDVYARRWMDINCFQNPTCRAAPPDNQLVWITQEDYVINNNGRVRGEKAFTDTDEDLFTVLKNSAFQTILMAKEQAIGLDRPDLSNNGDLQRMCAGGNCGPGAGRNIDLVITPDIGIALLQKIASDVDKLQPD